MKEAIYKSSADQDEMLKHFLIAFLNKYFQYWFTMPLLSLTTDFGKQSQ